MERHIPRERWRLLHQIVRMLELPMTVLGLRWLVLRELRGSRRPYAKFVTGSSGGRADIALSNDDAARRRRRYVTRKMLYSTPWPSMIRPWPTNTPCCSAAYLGSDVSNRGLVRKYC